MSLRDELLKDAPRWAPSLELPPGWGPLDPEAGALRDPYARHLREARVLTAGGPLLMTAAADVDGHAASVIAVERRASTQGMDAFVQQRRADAGAGPLGDDTRILRWMSERSPRHPTLRLHYLAAVPDTRRRRAIEWIATLSSLGSRSLLDAGVIAPWMALMDALLSGLDWRPAR